MQNRDISNEMKIITLFSVVSVFVVVLIAMVSFYNINTIHTVTENIYKHPLKVSNAALNVQKGVI